MKCEHCGREDYEDGGVITAEWLESLGWKRGSVSGRWYVQPDGRLEVEFGKRPQVYLACHVSGDRLLMHEITSRTQLLKLLDALNVRGER